MESSNGSWGVNHCLLEVDVLEAPQVRYTQDNQTPVAEMAVQMDGLRPDDPPGQLKVVGWGNLAQDLQNRVQVGQRLVLEGRLRMNTVTRQDGVKEKKAEFTLARIHAIGLASPAGGSPAANSPAAANSTPPPLRRVGGSAPAAAPAGAQAMAPAPAHAPSPALDASPAWNSSPLVPDLGEDEIPF